MELRKYLSELLPADRSAFAERCGTTMGHLRNVMYGYRPCSPELAAEIERASAGAVQRPDMRPADWHRIWPELVSLSASEE